MPTIDTEPLLSDAEARVAEAVDAAFRQYFRDVRAAVLRGSNATTADATPSDLPPNLDAWPQPTLWDSLVRRFIEPVVSVVFGDAFARAARDDIGQIHQYRTTYMASMVDRLSSALWPDDVYTQAQQALTQSVADGDSVPRMRNRLAQILRVDRFSWMAERIARTEAHAAVEGGTYSASRAWEEATGEDLYHAWIATPDARTRPEHLAAMGQTVRLGESFTVGRYRLRFPGDPTAPPDATINCRCTTVTGTWDELQDLAASATYTQGDTPMEDEAATVAPPDDDAPAPVMFRGPLAPLETRGDYRVLQTPHGDTVPVNDRMWLSYQERSSEGHDGKVTVGRIDRAWVQDGHVWGEGLFDVHDATGVTAEVIRKIRDGFAGTVSVDLSDGDFELMYVDEHENPVTPPDDIDELFMALEEGTIRELVYVTDWRLGGATLVQDPAFHTASIEIIDDPALIATATGDAGLPLAPRDHAWDGPAAMQRLQEAGRLSDGTFWRSPDADADSDVQADYKLPFADVIDGTLMAVPRGIFSVAGVLEGAMGGADIPEEDQETIRGKVNAYYQRMRAEFDDDDIEAPWEDNANAATVTASAKLTWHERVAAAVPAAPPAKWFVNPQLTGITKVRVTDEGRVYGHIADWRQRHVGIMGEKVYPPRCPHNGTYPRFHRFPVRTAEGGRVNTGPLATAGHAPTSAGVTMSAAMAHYDDPRFVVANVTCGEDEYGIWVAGALRPGVEPWQVAFLDTYGFSGDWRHQELVAACAVSVEGFFVPSDDSVHALAASAGVTPEVARVRASVVNGETVALVSAGVVAPSRADRRRVFTGTNQLMRLFADGNRQLMERLDRFAADIDTIAYGAAMRAVRDDRAIREAASAMEAEQRAEMAKLAKMMEE